MSLAHEIAQMLDAWGMRFQDPSLQKTSGKHARWYIRPVVPQVTRDGLVRVQKRIVLGTCAEMTKKDALRAKQRVMAEINGGAAVIQGQLRLADLVAAYREGRLPLLAASTRAKVESHLRRIKLLEQETLAELTPPRLQAWLLALDVAPATRVDVRNILSSIYEQARRWRLWTEPNPLTDVELGRIVPARERTIPTEEELRRLRAALDCCPAVVEGVTGRDVRLMVDVAVATGWRISEILGLRRDAIEGPYLVMRRRWHRGDLAEVAKTAAGIRRNYVGEELAAELAARPGEFVFSGAAGTPPDDRNLQQHILRPSAKIAGCYQQGFGFHSFRRLNVSWRAEAGAHPFEIARAAGHTRVDMSLHYTLTDGGREAAVVEKIKERIQ